VRVHSCALFLIPRIKHAPLPALYAEDCVVEDTVCSVFFLQRATTAIQPVLLVQIGANVRRVWHDGPTMVKVALEPE
jgi:hypothetical protein